MVSGPCQFGIIFFNKQSYALEYPDSVDGAMLNKLLEVDNFLLSDARMMQWFYWTSLIVAWL